MPASIVESLMKRAGFDEADGTRDAIVIGIAIVRCESEVKVKTDVGKFTFEVPEGHPQAGQKIAKTFEFKVCESREEAETVLTDKKLDIVSLVNDKLKANARSNAYQAALLPYKPSEVPQEDIMERMVRDAIRMGVPEDVARKNVAGLLGLTGTQSQPSDEAASE